MKRLGNFPDPPSPPFGSDLYRDIGSRLPNESIKVIFDVGAHTGQTSTRIASIYPAASIWSFEPVPSTYNRLAERVRLLPNVKCFNLGFSSASSEALFDTSAPYSEMYRLSANGTVTARIERLDRFCSDHGISEISLLKIDTEGSDLEVLKGGEQMLRESHINIVLAECSVNSLNTYHVALRDLHGHMEERAYRLFGLYEQTPEWPAGEPHLRRVNAAFISADVIARNVSRP